LPIYYATGSKAKSMLYALLAGLAEPLGALVVYFFLSAYLNSMAIGVMLGAVAGIMVYISLDELLPTANRFSRWHIGLSGLIFGMTMMAISLYFLN
jgi:ZIP family zinc transporter